MVTCNGRSYFRKSAVAANDFFVYRLPTFVEEPYSVLPRSQYTYLQLYSTDRAGNSKPIIGPLETSEPLIFGSGELFDGWRLRVQCSAEENTLFVKVAKWDAKNKRFAKDPLTGNDMDFDWKQSILFGEQEASPSVIVQAFFQPMSPKPSCK